MNPASRRAKEFLLRANAFRPCAGAFPPSAGALSPFVGASPRRTAEPLAPAARAALPGAGAVLLLAALLAGCGSAPPEPSAAEREAVGYNQRGARALRTGRIEDARKFYQAALRVDRSVENADGIAVNLLALARVDQAAGNLSSAQTHLDAVLDDAPLALPRSRKAEAAARKALFAFDAGDIARAADWSRRAEELCLPACAARAAITNLRARAALASGDAAGASRLARRALEAANGSGAGSADDPRIERANANRLIGEAAIALRDTKSARPALSDALALDQALGRADRIRRDLILLAQAIEMEGDRDGALAHYRRALEVATAAGDSAGADEARKFLQPR